MYKLHQSMQYSVFYNIICVYYIVLINTIQILQYSMYSITNTQVPLYTTITVYTYSVCV